MATYRARRSTDIAERRGSLVVQTKAAPSGASYVACARTNASPNLIFDDQATDLHDQFRSALNGDFPV